MAPKSGVRKISMLPTLRGAQDKNLEELRDEVANDCDPLLVAPCGYGKGTLISVIVHSAVSMGKSVIFGVRGASLVIDMSGRVRRLGIPHGILVGGKRRERWHPTQVASIDTLYRIDPLPVVDILIIDEAHMALSPTWMKTIARLRSRNQNMVVIGMTATPIRLDGKGLGRAAGGIFDSLVLGPSVLELIADGYLCRSRVLEPPAVEGAKEIKVTKTNDNLAAQAAVFDRVKLIGDEIKHYKEHADGKKGVTFCTDQKHANHVAEQFTLAGIPWAYIDANTPLGDEAFPVPGTRAHIYRDLDAENGNLMGISSVDCVSTGWDHSIISYLGMMRLSGSFGWWHQAMGRGSRIHRGKDHFLIIDHAGNSERHKPFGYFESPIEWSLDGAAVKVREGERQIRIITCAQSVMNCWCGRRDAHDSHGAHTPCYGTFKAGPEQCPHCGCPIPKKTRKIETEDRALVDRRGLGLHQQAFPASPTQLVAEVFREAEGRMRNEAQKRKQLDYLLREAEKKGNKSGWARHRYIARFNEEPPRSWMPPEWQESH